MKNHRPERVASLIQEELGKLLLREVEFPAFVTITSVEVDGKLQFANVRLSVIPSASDKKILAIAEKNERHLQNLLFKKLNIRPMPSIQFELDAGPANAARVEEIILHQKDSETG